MQRAVFEEKALSQCRYAVGLAALTFLIAGCAAGSFYRGLPAAALSVVIVGGLGLCVLYRQAAHTAQRVVVSDVGLVATDLFHRIIGDIAWQDIDEIQRFVKPTLNGPIAFVRIRSRRTNADFTFHERLPGFVRLYEIVEERATGAHQTTPTLMERLLWL